MLISKTLRGFQWGAESAQGTAVSANRLFKNGTIKPIKRVNNNGKVTAEGHKSAVGQQKGKRWSTWSCDGKVGYNILPYWASMIYGIGIATPTTVVAGAYSYGGTMSSTNVDTPQTATFEFGNNQGSNNRMAFGTATDFSITVNKNSVDYSVAGFGAYPTKNITMTPTPTLIPSQIMGFPDCRVNYSATFSGLSSGKLLTPTQFMVSVKSKYASQIFIDDATISIGGILEKQPDISGSITVAEGSESDIFLGNLETTTLGYLQLQCTGPLLVSGTPNTYSSFKYTIAMYIQDEEETSDEELFAGKYNFYSAEDTVNGDVNISTICGLTAL